MAVQTRDLRCHDCGEIYWGVACEYRKYGNCGNCGGELEITWEGRQAPSTDVYGSPQYSDASGQLHTSQREKIKYMREWGYEEAGDKVGGARNEHRIKGTGYSFPGQKNRRTVSEGH